MLTTHLVWPKVLGITCAITSFGLLMSEVDVFWWRYAFDGDPAHIASWAFTLSFAALLVLSYPLYRGREWARRSVLILGGSLVLAAAVIEIIRGIGRMDAFGPLTGWVLVLFITRVVTTLGAIIGFFTPSVMLLWLLCHRDVRTTFHEQPPTI